MFDICFRTPVRHRSLNLCPYRIRKALLWPCLAIVVLLTSAQYYSTKVKEWQSVTTRPNRSSTFRKTSEDIYHAKQADISRELPEWKISKPDINHHKTDRPTTGNASRNITTDTNLNRLNDSLSKVSMSQNISKNITKDTNFSRIKEFPNKSSAHQGILNPITKSINISGINGSHSNSSMYQDILKHITNNNNFDRIDDSPNRLSTYQDILHNISSCGNPTSCYGRIPRIVHLIWYQPRRTFLFPNAVCVLSIHKFIRPDMIILWHDVIPNGKWWNYIRRKINITLIYRQAPSSIFGRPVDEPAHKADITRLEVLHAYGGIYMDTDMVILRPLKPLLHYTLTLGYATPQNLGNGFIIAAKEAPFIKLWYSSYETFHDKIWSFHSLVVPTMLAVKHPSLIHVEPQTSFFYPNWKQKDWLFEEGKVADWSKNYAIHLYYRLRPKNFDISTFDLMNNTIGEVFRFIMYGNPEIRPWSSKYRHVV